MNVMIPLPAVSNLQRSLPAPHVAQQQIVKVRQILRLDLSPVSLLAVIAGVVETEAYPS